MSTGSRYIPTLNGWRAISVIGVVLYHGRFHLFSGTPLLMRVASHGNIGVDVFFAISGFLITEMLLREYRHEGSIQLRRFYARRCLRILPPYFAVLALIAALSFLGAIQINHADMLSCLLFYRNYKPLGVDLQGGFYTAHFWSLAVEEHFYLLWPTLLIALKPKRAGIAALILALGVFVWRTLEVRFGFLSAFLPQANIMARTDTRIDALLWGCLAALYFPTLQRLIERLRFPQLWLAVAAIVVACQALRLPGLTLLTAVLLPLLLLSTVCQPGCLLGRLLEWKLLRWLGTISYSLYLLQELFLPEVRSEASTGFLHYLQQPPWNLVAILVGAILSRYLIEIPFARLGHMHFFPRKPPQSVRPAASVPVEDRAC